jgi:amino acid permease
MLQWIWFFVFLVAGIALLAWRGPRHTARDFWLGLLRVVLGWCLLVLSVVVKCDLLVERPYDWISTVIPEPDTTAHTVTAMLFTGLLVSVYITGTIYVTILVSSKRVEQPPQESDFQRRHDHFWK